jgi:hypothetical protein
MKCVIRLTSVMERTAVVEVKDDDQALALAKAWDDGKIILTHHLSYDKMAHPEVVEVTPQLEIGYADHVVNGPFAEVPL